ncbi:DUF3857 domain-containing protein [Saccharicrinis sp. 156]|uniref:DUF3857 domain-containing protein n=1 Tax=Saccharicrinis sp. 156 TaxID=3417574 RepID=UPI003D33E7F9
MRLRYKLIFALFVFTTLAFAKKTPMYPVSAIPAELLKGADAVVRKKSTVVEVVSESKMYCSEKFAITILKESGKDKALFRESYTNLSSVSNITAIVYDALGKKVKSIPTGEINDFTAISGASLYEDRRVKAIDPKYSVYPFTVEYTFEKKYNSAYYLHGWYAFQGYNTAVEDYRFKLLVPLDFKFHYKEYNLPKTAEEVEVDEKRQLFWQIQNYKAPQKEVLSAHYEHWGPAVAIAPNRFEINDYKGDLNSWASFGRFFFELNKGRDNVPQATIDHLATMLNENMSDYEKISTIYQYSQKKNRYISIQEGIGAQQPFEAETVDRLSYGDCKALSNYVVSILRNFGYNAYYVLVQAGEESFSEKDFVNDYFNHVIACVPLDTDTIWLECTNSFIPCGYLGDFTDDRNVLLITEEGGKLVKTPGFDVEENNQSIKGDIKIFDDGSASGKALISYKGSLYSDEYGLLLMDETDRRKKIIKSINVPHFDLIDYEIVQHKLRKPWLDKSLSISIPGFASKMGERLFFSLNGMNKSSVIPPYSRNRRSPMMISRSYSECDSMTYLLPEDYKMEAIPEPVELKSEFGEYRSKAKIIENRIVYERSLKIWKGQYPKERYNDFVEFLEKIAKYDEVKAVLVKSS